MYPNFTVSEADGRKVYSCEQYECAVSTWNDGSVVLEEITVRPDIDKIDELYVPEGVTYLCFRVSLSNKDCEVKRIIMPSTLKKFSCSEFTFEGLTSRQPDSWVIDIEFIDFPSFSFDIDGYKVGCQYIPYVYGLRISLEQLVALKGTFPKAFEKKEDGKCLFDNGWRVPAARVRLLDQDTVVLIRDNGFGNIPEFVKPYERALFFGQVDINKKYRVAAVIITTEEEKSNLYSSNTGYSYAISFPRNIQYFGLDAPHNPKEYTFDCLDFNGNMPFVFCNKRVYNLKELRVNSPVSEVQLSECVMEMLKDSVYNGRVNCDGKVVYAAPELSSEASSVPGYIKVTLERNDKLIDVNAQYILSVEPYAIERYTPITGSLITLVPIHSECAHRVVVYESCDIVLKKIKDAQESLSQNLGGVSGLISLLKFLCEKKAQ